MIHSTGRLGVASSLDPQPLEELMLRLEERSATIGVVGLGYVGLPLAVEFATSFSVVGFDPNAKVVGRLSEGRSHIADVPDVSLREVLDVERFGATSDFSRLADCDAIVICVPTPLEKSKDPDLSYVKSAASSIAAHLRPGQLVVLESTTYPGTTDELLLPLLQQTGLRLDEDFLLAFSPERVDPGNSIKLNAIPKVVGGVSEASTRAACTLYGSVMQRVHPVSNSRVAETVKLLENTFRFVNIGLVNEFAQLCNQLSIDTHEVIEAAATKPFGFMPFFPGPGVGGHCIPLDPLYLNWKASQQGFLSRFIELADTVNSNMPAYVVERIAAALNEQAKAVRDSRILIVGVAYKDDIEDTRQSPAIAVIDRLRARGAIIAYHDPYVPLLDFDFHDWPEWRSRETPITERRGLRLAGDSAIKHRRRYDALESVELTAELVAQADCVVVLARHSNVDYASLARNARLIVDTRNAIPRTISETCAQVIRL